MANLQALSESVLLSSKKYSGYVAKCNYLILILAIASIYIIDSYLFFASVSILLLQLLIWAMQFHAENKKVLGQALIRHNLIEKGFGEKFPTKLSYLRNQITNSENDGARYLKRDDYYSAPQKADENFLSLLKESCFWSSSLYLYCIRSEVIRVLIMTLILIVSLVSVTFFDQTPDSNFSVQRALMVVVGTFPFWQSIKNAIKYNFAMNKLKDIDSELKDKPKSLPELSMLFAEYSVITSATPLIPDELYVKNRKKIQGVWDSRQVT